MTRASTAGEFGGAIERALDTDGADLRFARQQFARANSWTARAIQVGRVVADVASRRGPAILQTALAGAGSTGIDTARRA